MAPNRRAWERRPGESARAFHQFNVYLRLGPSRDFVRAAAEVGVRADTLRSTASEWDWQARAAAWDDHIQHEFVKGAETQVKKLAEQHVNLAQGLTAVVGIEVQKLLREAQAHPHRTISVSELVRIMRTASDLLFRATMGDSELAAADASVESMTTAELRAELEAHGVRFTD